MNMGGNGQLSVPPGFRFHPTDEELLYYYLMKKVSYEPIDLDVIREIDLNKLEPWDLKEKCRIGTGPQNEWYFFSHKDKKYPTGTRTNRATTAGFWKATGRDKPIHLPNSKRIGMRKTLVFYTGRAPHGQKTDWIMHEYRLDDHANSQLQQEDGWVVCRVFKKKNLSRANFQVEEEEHLSCEITKHGAINSYSAMEPRQSHKLDNYNFDLPQLFSPESAVPPPSFVSPATMSLNTMDIECSHNLLRLTSTGSSSLMPQHGGDWSFLDKLLASSSSSSHHSHHLDTKSQLVDLPTSSTSEFPFQYLVNQPDFFKFIPK